MSEILIDKLPWSGTSSSTEISTEDNYDEVPESIIMQQSGRGYVIDTSNYDEFLPCTDETTSSEKSSPVLREMIDVGLQKALIMKCNSPLRNKSLCIYKVEQNLKKVHEESTFHPKLISIGPFHHNKSEHLKLMEQHKWRFFLDFLESMKLTSSTAGATTTTDDDDDTIIMTKKKQCLVAAMEKLEAKARACYSETFDDLSSNEFRMMMLLDGCFIIQLLHLFQKSGRNCRNDVDSIFSWRSRLPHLRHDLLLLENQLPFFVLQKMFEISGIDKERYKLTDLIFDFFNPVLCREKKVLDKCKRIYNTYQSSHRCHLLELFMLSFQLKTFEIIILQAGYVDAGGYYPEYIPNDGRDQDMSIHCVTELREAGVVFKKRDYHDLLDIEFKNGSFHIPTLFIDGNTVPVLLNFIAYEQRHHSIKPHFTSYLMFLNYLVNSSGDVEHLHYKGIINHGLGSDDEVATLFNKLCKEVVLELGDNNYLSTVFKDVNQYFGKRRNRWRAAWKHEYFRTPWAFSSFLAAIVFIVLTFLQTYFSMYAYFHPP